MRIENIIDCPPPALPLIAATVLAVAGLHAAPVERHLGPTGMFGLVSQAEIRVTKVQDGSPAHGKIRVDDMIVGAGGVLFKEDVRWQLAEAIDEAETEAARGILVLTLKGPKVGGPELDDKGLAPGNTQVELTAPTDTHYVELQLKVLGSYSDTAPYNCPKTDAIITQTADYVVRTQKFGRLDIGLLGLLATGEQKYIDVVKEVLHEADWAKPDIELSLQGTSKAWRWGYTGLILCEYYLLTRDDYVLPALKAYAVAIARGRDAAGLWGHRMADPEANRGQLHGRLHGYAVMNQSSLPLFNSLLLADKCGVEHPELQAGIEQTHGFYTEFIGRGTLPYGVHDPNAKSYNNNGMSGSAAVAMALKGDERGAVFFSRMSVAGHKTMEGGHTGHYFNQLWTGLGANLAGPEASAAFFRKTRWLHTLNRTWDGTFTYDGGGNYSYRGLSDAGSHLLNYCLGRAKLCITGRDADKSVWLKGEEVAETIALPDMDMKGKSDAELLDLFDHPMPKVRVEAIWTLRPREHKLATSIRTMLTAGNPLERESAVGYFGYGCPKELVMPVKDDLVAMMRDPDEDMDLRARAAGALCWLGEDAYPYFSDMLKLVIADKPGDPLGRINGELGGRLNALCKDPYAAGLVTDKPLFYAAVHRLLDHKRAKGRTAGAQLIANIPLEDFHYVADKVKYIIDDQDLTYHAYHNLGPQTAAISILANLNVEGGIESAFDILNAETGKAGFKIRMLMAVLPKYGAGAKYALPKIKAVNAGKFQKSWDTMIKEIESATHAGKTVTLEEAKQAGLGNSE